MDALLEWARGPCFIFAFVFMLLGLARHVILNGWEIIRTMRRAGDKNIPYILVVTNTLKWLAPIDKLKSQFLFTMTSILFHAAILIVPIRMESHF